METTNCRLSGLELGMCLNETWSRLSSSKKSRENIFHTGSWISWTPDRRVMWIKPLDVFSPMLRHATCNNADYTNNTLWITHIFSLVHDYIYHICCFCDRSIFTLSCETHWFIYFKQKNSQKRQKKGHSQHREMTILRWFVMTDSPVFGGKICSVVCVFWLFKGTNSTLERL